MRPSTTTAVATCHASTPRAATPSCARSTRSTPRPASAVTTTQARSTWQRAAPPCGPGPETTATRLRTAAKGLAQVNLTAATPVTADSAKVTTDMTRWCDPCSVFGSTVTVTIQLVGANDADAVRDSGPATAARVTIRRVTAARRTSGEMLLQRNVTDRPLRPRRRPVRSTSTPAARPPSRSQPPILMRLTGTTRSVPTRTRVLDPVTPAVPDKIDRVRVTYTVEVANGGQAVD